MRGLSLFAASGGHSSSRCAGLSLSRPLLLRSTGCRRAGSVIVAHGLSSSAACGIFPDQGSNPCPLHRQADSQPLRHQGSPVRTFNIYSFSQFQICNTLLLNTVTIDLFILKLKICTFWPPSPISPTPDPRPSGSHQSVLCMYELGFCLFGWLIF